MSVQGSFRNTFKCDRVGGFLDFCSFCKLKSYMSDRLFRRASFNSVMVECVGVTSTVLLNIKYELVDLSRSACAFIMHSTLADQPYSDVTKTYSGSMILFCRAQSSVNFVAKLCRFFVDLRFQQTGSGRRRHFVLPPPSILHLAIESTPSALPW